MRHVPRLVRFIGVALLVGLPASPRQAGLAAGMELLAHGVPGGTSLSKEGEPTEAAPAAVREPLPGAVAGDDHPSAGQTILDTHGYWRCHVTLRPTVFGTQAKAEPHRLGSMGGWRWNRAVLPPDGPRTEAPPDDWAEPDFDDRTWWRHPGPFFGGEPLRIARIAAEVYLHSRYGNSQPISMALICLRGKFNVTNPAAVGRLTLDADFRGGLAVYLNGREVARRHLPAGPLSADSLADDYPWETWVNAEGTFMLPGRSAGTDLERMERRIRHAEGLDLPTQALRRGVNVLALAIHRAAQHPDVITASVGRTDPRANRWNTAGLLKARLTATGAGIEPNVGRPAGFQVWNANPLEGLFPASYGDRTEPLGAIRIVGTRNGRFSGQVVVSADTAIRGFGASLTALRHADGGPPIPRDRLLLRFPRPGPREARAKYPFATESEGRRPVLPRFDALLPSPPDEVPIDEVGFGVTGAVQPVWLTVRVPADAAAGRYTGTLIVEAQGLPATEVPVTLEVHDFRLPDPADFQTSVGFLQMPESLADYYQVPLWSEAHWRMIRESLRLLALTGNQVLYLPLIAGTHFGNQETLVRWIREGEGYRHDFSLMERYLDTALAAGLRPRIVCLQVWDYHIGSAGRDHRIGTGRYGQSEVFEARPVPVSLLDPDGGAVTRLAGPAYTAPEAKAFWQPVAEGVRRRLAERGLEKTLMLGLCGDYLPIRQTVDLWRALLPEAAWVTMGHGTVPTIFNAPVGYATVVFGANFVDPALERKQGWERPRHVAYFPRYAENRGVMGLAYERTFFEFGLLCGLRGAGRQVLDDFRDPDARRRTPDCNWGSLTPGLAWLAPGPEGPVSSVRFEMGVEGIQECEARIFIEQALADEALAARLDPALVRRARAILDERTRCVAWSNEQNTNQVLHSYLPTGPLGSDWYAGSDWQSRSDHLYRAAAEIARADLAVPRGISPRRH